MSTAKMKNFDNVAHKIGRFKNVDPRRVTWFSFLYDFFFSPELFSTIKGMIFLDTITVHYTFLENIRKEISKKKTRRLGK